MKYVWMSALALVGALGTGAAQASTVTLQFAGVIDRIPSNLDLAIEATMDVSGSFTYDTAAHPQCTGVNGTNCFYNAQSFSLNLFGPVGLSLAVGAPYLTVADQGPLKLGGYLWQTSPRDFAEPIYIDLPLPRSGSLNPPTSVDFSQLSGPATGSATLFVYSPNDPLTFHLTSLSTASAVPEVSVMGMALLGLTGLMAAARRRPR